MPPARRCAAGSVLCRAGPAEQDDGSTVQQEHRVEVGLRFPDAPVQAGSGVAMRAGVRHGAHHLAGRHPGADRDSRGHRFHRGAQAVVVPDRQHGAVDDHAREGDGARPRREDGCSGRGVEVDASVPRGPGRGWPVERVHHDEVRDRGAPRVRAPGAGRTPHRRVEPSVVRRVRDAGTADRAAAHGEAPGSAGDRREYEDEQEWQECRQGDRERARHGGDNAAGRGREGVLCRRVGDDTPRRGLWRSRCGVMTPMHGGPLLMRCRRDEQR